MYAETNQEPFNLPCGTAEAIRFITLAQRTFSEDAPNWPEKYHHFVKLLTRYRDGEIDVQFFLRQVQFYLLSHPQLIPKFNDFLPPGYCVISPPTSPASNSIIADRRRASRALLTERELTERKSLRYIDRVRAAYRKPDGSDGLETRMFLDLLQKKTDKQEDVAELRDHIHALFYLHPSLANEFDGFLHREYFAGRVSTTTTTILEEPAVLDLASPTISPTFERLALPDEDLTPTQMTLELPPDVCDMDIDDLPNPASSHSSEGRTASPVPSLSSSSRTVSVESSPSNRSVCVARNVSSSPCLEDVKRSDTSAVCGSPNLGPFPFYPALSTSEGENGDIWERTPSSEERMGQKTPYGRGFMDLLLDRPRRFAAVPSPIASPMASYPPTCNPSDTTFTGGVVSMPPELEIHEDGWIHGGSGSRSVLYPFGVAAGRGVRLEAAPTLVEPTVSSTIIPSPAVPISRRHPLSLPQKPITTPPPLRRTYAKVVQQGYAQPFPTPSMEFRATPLGATFQPTVNSTSSGFQGALQFSTLPSTWVNSSRDTTSSSSRSTKRKQKKPNSRRGVGSDPDPAIPADAIRKMYGHGAIGEGRPRTDIKWVDEGLRSSVTKLG
ncbi:hypothetical protein FRC04_010340 [Tulasnella sp. 424]|nr:hypothetical protein FRC04_010340 [Tulasnella sp. 424]KAG8978722.1 hypothetical protein FRC05_009995 [Tulasnella sp. 425]